MRWRNVAWLAGLLPVLLACPPKLGVRLHLVIEIDDPRSEIIDLDDAIERVIIVIRERVKQAGVRGINIERSGDQIVAELERVLDPDRLLQIIQMDAFLEFRITDMEGQFDQEVIERIDAALEPSGLSQFLSAGRIPSEFLVAEENWLRVEGLMQRPAFQRNIPGSIELLWGSDQVSMGGRSYRSLYSVQSRPIITGEYVTGAEAVIDPTFNQAVVTFELSRQGGSIFGRATSEHIGDYMAIVLDGRVQGLPPVIRSRIGRRGRVELGNARLEDAWDLAIVLRSGALPAPISIVEERRMKR